MSCVTRTDMINGKFYFVKDDKICFDKNGYDGIYGNFSAGVRFVGVRKGDKWGYVGENGVMLVPYILSENDINVAQNSVDTKNRDDVPMKSSIADLMWFRENAFGHKNFLTPDTVENPEFLLTVLYNEAMTKADIGKKFKISDDLFVLLSGFDSCTLVDKNGKMIIPVDLKQREMHDLIIKMHQKRTDPPRSRASTVLSSGIIAVSKLIDKRAGEMTGDYQPGDF